MKAQNISSSAADHQAIKLKIDDPNQIGPFPRACHMLKIAN